MATYFRLQEANMTFPPPILHADIDSIKIETNDSHSGSFTIKNIGGGTLSGHVLSRFSGLVFEPTTWTGNRQTICYTLGAAGLPSGTAEGIFYISSNGGEIELPVSATLSKMTIATDEGHTITSLADFFEYAQAHPAQARRLFVDGEFYMLLLAIGYQYMEVYEALHKDSNRERAMDNFFILSGLKPRTTLCIPNRRLVFTQNPNDTTMLYGNIQVYKSDFGYADAQVTTSVPWLNFYASRLTTSDFKDTLSAALHFSIDPTQIAENYVREQVTIGTDIIEISYRRNPPLSMKLSRTTYRFDDSGTIDITNNTGQDMRVEVFCPESYVRFSAKSYLVGANGQVPFGIKLSPFLSAQLFFRKLPYMKTELEIKATVPGAVYVKKLPVVVGEW